MARMLSFNAGAASYDIHVLNPGDRFPGFGGSKRPLVVMGSPSIVVRELHAGCLSDTEYSATDQTFWRWMSSLLDTSISLHGVKGPDSKEGD